MTSFRALLWPVYEEVNYNFAVQMTLEHISERMNI